MSTTIDLASDPGAEHRARDLRIRLACIIPALQPTTRGLSGLAVAAALSLCGATGILLIRLEPLFVIGAVTLAVATILMFRWPELGTLLGFLALYTNAPAVAVHFHGSPNAVAVSFLPLFGVPLFYYILYRREKLILDRTFRLMLALLLATTVSACFSKDLGIALEWILTFAVEGLVLYFLITNVVRTLPTLKRVVAVLLIASAFLGGLSLLQEFGHSYSNQFGGFAQKNLEFVKGEEEFRSAQEKVRLANRAEGPLGDANRYAQILIVLAPLDGASYVGDEWIYLRLDGRRALGIPEPIRLWGWHLEELPALRNKLSQRNRWRLRSLELAALSFEKMGPNGDTPPSPWQDLAQRLGHLVKRRCHVHIEPLTAFDSPHWVGSCHPKKLFLVGSHDASEIDIEPISGLEVAERMVFSLREEFAGLFSYYNKFRFAFPQLPNPLIDRCLAVRPSALAKSLQGLESYRVSHPYPVSFPSLFQQMSPYCE